ncbi:hypothetical protein U4960_09235 [Altererythrobacter sp. H2]|uniref:hypothetical protein n=1 Tax=Altererythrobacter sp. H2 TaxID=3108391 RepID=UPI002B4BCCB8|nr:hypothetical protein [Altererythrobacter sp. H2]WRK94482.1 hypothetical protein U4960_09235 [Altererythrobacter sp. H2]
MRHLKSWLPISAVLLIALTIWLSPAGAGDAAAIPTSASFQERQCMERGWNRATVNVAGQPRELLWKGPPSVWRKGAIILMHGGGGEHFQWCVANARIVAPQVRFSEQAVAEGFAVFLLNSSDRVTDNERRVCGKIWDDEVRDRANLDLPFIGEIMQRTIPQARPAGSQEAIFFTGLSSGDYMTVRAATHFNGLVTAFAPVSSGDPYGWRRVCEAGLSPRAKVNGAGYDNETGKQIIEPASCKAGSYPNEAPWDDGGAKAKPAYRLFHHEMDGINDASCAEKAGRQLRAHGYPGEPDFLLKGGRRSLMNHLWQDEYNQPILDFFARQLEAEK